MLMDVWQKIGMQFPGTLFWFMVVPFLGVLNSRKSLFSWLQRHAAKEALWLCSLIFQLFKLDLKPTMLFSDNKSPIKLTKDHQFHPQTKHINIHFHFICYIVENGSIQLIYCPTEDMITDTLTKALPSTKVKHFTSEFGLLPAWGGVFN